MLPPTSARKTKAKPRGPSRGTPSHPAYPPPEHQPQHQYAHLYDQLPYHPREGFAYPHQQVQGYQPAPPQSAHYPRLHPPPPTPTSAPAPTSTSTSTATTTHRSRDRDSKRRLPPPPPPAVASASVSSGGLSGFQVDYTRVDTSRPIRRPRVVWYSDSDDDEDVDERELQRRRILDGVQDGEGVDGVDGRRSRKRKMYRPEEEGPEYVGEVRPPPPEAYVLLRPHRRPKDMSVWDDGVETQLPHVENWSYTLNIIQYPSRGKALGLQALPRGWPALSSPLIIQLIVRDADGNILPPDNSALSRRLVHTVMMVELVSADHKELRSVMRVRPHANEYGTVDYTHSSWIGHHKNLLGSTIRSATALFHGDEKGLYFVFAELVVRNTGTYALQVKLLDIAGPPHVGTSIGVTPVLVTDHTPPFQVYHATKYPGSMPVTDLSLEFTRQGERNLGRDKRKTRDDRGISSDEEGSPEGQGGMM
ncbi:hypothetical protein IAT38_000516 [Cryptococcus sp. DSM 104549]